jgi:hypothetical protein
MSFVSNKKNNLLCTATYDGSIHVYRPSVAKDSEDKSMVLENVASKSAVHSGPIQCLAAATDKDSMTWIATGSMDHSLALHTLDAKTKGEYVRDLCWRGARQRKAVSISGVLINSLHLVTGMGCLHLGFPESEESVEDEQRSEVKTAPSQKEGKDGNEKSRTQVLHSGPLVQG